MLNLYARTTVRQLETRLVRATRLAVAMKGPPWNQRAMANGHITQISLIGGTFVAGRSFGSVDLNSPTSDQQAVQRESAASLARDTECVGSICHVIQQTNDRTYTVGRPDLKALALIQGNVQRFGVHASVHNLDNRRNWFWF